MAFDITKFSRIGTSATDDIPITYVYPTTDSVATVTTPGYFPASSSDGSNIRDGSRIQCYISNVCYEYIANVSGDTISLSNALGNYSPSDDTIPTWTGTPAPPDGVYGTSYSYDVTLNVTGATSYSASGLPSWASIDTTTGLITGDPDAVETTSGIIVTATNTSGSSASGSFPITINAGAPVWSEGPTLGWDEAEQPTYNYSQWVDLKGGTVTGSGYTVNTGAFPSAIIINATTGITEGTVAAGEGGSNGVNYPVNLSVETTGGTSTQTFFVFVAPAVILAPTWGTIPPQNWTVDDVIDFELSSYITDNGGDSSITYSLKGGTTLPPGLDVVGSAVTGTISASTGTPFSPQYNALNSGGSTDSVAHTVTVVDSLPVGDTGLLLDDPATTTGLLFEDPLTDFTKRVSFAASTYTVVGTAGTILTVTINREGATAGAMNQNILVSNGGSYITGPILADLGDGETTRDIDIVIGTDTGDATVVLTFSANSTIDGNPSATVSVTDATTAATVEFASATYSFDEGINPVLVLNRTGPDTTQLVQNIQISGSNGYLVEGDYDATMEIGETTISVTITANSIRSGYQGGASFDAVLDDNAGGQSSTRVTIVDTEFPTGAIFSDSFETGDMSHTENGVRWSSGGGINVEITDTFPRTGTYSAEFTYQGTGADLSGRASAQINFYHESVQITDYWLQFYFYYPDGNEGLGFNAYESRESTGPDNNKFFRITHPDPTIGDNKAGAGASTKRTGGGPATKVFAEYAKYGGGMGQNGLVTTTTAITTGVWHRLRYHAKLATYTGGVPNTDGVIELWIDDDKYTDAQNIGADSGDGPFAAFTPSQNWFGKGYLFGSANSGFTLETKAFIDDVVIATSEAALP